MVSGPNRILLLPFLSHGDSFLSHRSATSGLIRFFKSRGIKPKIGFDVSLSLLKGELASVVGSVPPVATSHVGAATREGLTDPSLTSFFFLP